MRRPYGVLLALALLLLAAPGCTSSSSSTSPVDPATASASPSTSPTTSPTTSATDRVPTVAQVAEIYPHLVDAEVRVRSTRVRRVTDDCGAGRPYAGVRALRASYSLLGAPAGLVTGPGVGIETLTFDSAAAAGDFVRTHVDDLAACGEHERTEADKWMSSVETLRFEVGHQHRGFTQTSQAMTMSSVDHLLAARDGRQVVLVSVSHPMPNNPVESAVRLTRLALEAATS